MGVVVQGGFAALEAHSEPAGAVTADALPLRAEGWSRSQRLWWLLWCRCPGVGWVRLLQLLHAFGDLAVAWQEPLDRYRDRLGWGEALLRAVESFRRAWGQDPLPRFAASAPDRRLLLPGDRRWPAGVIDLDRPPLALHWQGRGSLWRQLGSRRSVAVVGTRRPSSHGLTMAERLGHALGRAGWPVVSGLAEGIDAAAHRGCLAAGGLPVAVLGTPLDRVYPRHHALLQSQVARDGLLISEQPPGSGIRAGHFASRNRLLVAMSAAVVVVECPASSGALHSAEWAWKQGLPLWVVPADAAKRSALGSNQLLARGATPLLDPEDLISLLGAPPRPIQRAGPEPSPPPGGSAQARLLQAVGDGISLEQLMAVLGQSAAELAPQLLELELNGALRAEPGLHWRPCSPRP